MTRDGGSTPLAVAVVVLWLALAPVARADLTLSGDTARLGRIHLAASPAAADLRIVELVDGAAVPLHSRPTAAGVEAKTDWICERQERTFQAVGDGQSSATYVATTPSCEGRLQLLTRPSVRRGENVRVTVRDDWRVGGERTRLCVRPPGDFYDCRPLLLPRGEWELSRVFRSRTTGHWGVRLDAPGQLLARRIAVRGTPRPPGALPSVLLTGDSMMLKPRRVLKHRLPARARIRGDVYIGSGITKPYVVDWARLPGQQVRADHPDATVIVLGMGDVYGFGEIACCGDDWQAEYARRLRRMMRTYEQGKAAVVWLNLPYPRNPRRAPAVTAINAALASAAHGLRRVRVLDIASIFTPGGVYSDTIERNGRPLTVRNEDGIHLSLAGARIAARAVTDALVALGVLQAGADSELGS